MSLQQAKPTHIVNRTATLAGYVQLLVRPR